MYALEGGSFGLQLGAESTDVVMLVMNNRGVDRHLVDVLQKAAPRNDSKTTTRQLTRE